MRIKFPNDTFPVSRTASVPSTKSFGPDQSLAYRKANANAMNVMTVTDYND